MNALLALLLDEPQRFTAADLPCCLLGIWELALSDSPDSASVSRSVSRTNSSPASSRKGVHL